MLLDPVTLERDYNEEDIQNRKDRREEFDEWVGVTDPSIAKNKLMKAGIEIELKSLMHPA